MNKKIQPGDEITLKYKIYWANDELVFQQDQTTVTLGHDDLLAALEQQLLGLTVGTYEITLNPDQAYGPSDPTLMEEVELESLPVELRVKDARIVAQDEDGEDVDVRIHRIDQKKHIAVIDFNHPLAGHTLTFKIQILAIQ